MHRLLTPTKHFAVTRLPAGRVAVNHGSRGDAEHAENCNRDSCDKIVFDDLKHNATLAAMMAYLASEDPEFIKRDRSAGTWPANWPANCGTAPKSTRPRY